MRFASSVLLMLLSGTAGAACPGQTQMELNQCAAAEYQRADAMLNAAWGPTKSFMDDIGHGGLLLDAQRKWLAFRDAACAAETAPFAGGSIQPMIWFSCMTRLTQARTQDLYELRR